ncbi:hypothetical protein GH714_043548 [Hevea brasiliensis]|uniref:Pentatricopeptide repeat-containing protein n=1 Tax=Hevea brasiliensis TaxID=3981 RepID=A0A6A6K352_HEVBR|nr:hypothetical protein GH714_043548 [Hevea brasiliensis]
MVVDVAMVQEVDTVEATHVMQLPPRLKILGSSPPWVASESLCVFRSCNGLPLFRIRLQSARECKSKLVHGTWLVIIYSKCGDLENALKLFLEIPRRDIVTWNAMVCGYAPHGASDKALSLFDEMKNEGIKPYWITFVALLLACNSAGSVDLRVKYYHSMVSDHGV